VNSYSRLPPKRLFVFGRLTQLHRALLAQVLQGTAWQLGFRQGSPQDARQLEALFGQALVKDESWGSDGLTTTRMVKRPRVAIDERMNALEPGDAWLRVAPIDKGWRQERVRVAPPSRKQVRKPMPAHAASYFRVPPCRQRSSGGLAQLFASGTIAAPARLPRELLERMVRTFSRRSIAVGQ
jgi:hypothetical protein